MEELSKIAMAYFHASSGELQLLARDFFRAMDNDRDGKVDQKEFLEFMRDEGYAQMTSPSFFKQLELDGNGTLDFFEVMTLYYIVKSGRPFCNCCKKFITSTYLLCVGCLEDPTRGPFYLCLNCFSDQKCDHTHNDMSRFLDNYSLLEAVNKSKLTELISPDHTRSRPFATVQPVHNPSSGTYNHTWNPSSSSNYQVPYNISWNHPSPATIYQAPPYSWNNPSSAEFQVPYRPTPDQNHYMWNPSGVTPPLQNVDPSVHNQTWIHNNYSTYNYQPPQHFQYPPAPPPNAIVPQRHDGWKIALAVLDVALTSAVVGSTLCTIL